ncbi:MAG: ferritin family protein [Polyangiaceae bacterium]|nr:ferritin family protein [Polyangiaceae bacterium]
MTTFKSAEEILDFAIRGEEEAEKFYTELAASSKTPAMKHVFTDFAAEERGHKAKLVAVKEGKLGQFTPSFRIIDLKLADYLVDVKPTPNMSYQDALIVAMKREKAAFKLYTDLATKTQDAGLKATFTALANEEAKHKMRFEIEYDDKVLVEN